MAEKRISEEEVARCWNGNAETWAKMVREGWDIFRDEYQLPAFLEFIGDISGKLILDAGCGEGYNTRTFARLGARLVGVDISGEMIKLARRSETDEPLGIRYEVASFTDMDIFAGASFDMVLSTVALMDGPDFAGATRELHRVLKPGGELVFSILHPCFVTSQGSTWVTDDDGNPGLFVSRYYDRTHEVTRWRYSRYPDPESVPPFEVPYFPRTLSEYINAVCDAGFTIKAIDEPRPSKEAAEKHPVLAKRRIHGAHFLFVKAVKG
jgi:SAM-dependent methyltransferase